MRIIPARAGFTASEDGRLVLGGDHPRSRGVYHFVMPRFPTHVGSSPLARGLPALPVRGRNREGDHPRSRGVYPASGIGAEAMVGSSPLARGLRPDIRLVGDGLRIIPARAGFTGPRSGALLSGRDHPRSRGVYVTGGLSEPVVPGSSPLARGLPSGPPPVPSPERIIPARAGFTSESGSCSWCPPDHPRSRGVYSYDRTKGNHKCGSSPLARGLPHPERKTPMIDRIIPARAGFTAAVMVVVMTVPDHPRSRGVYPGSYT